MAEGPAQLRLRGRVRSNGARESLLGVRQDLGASNKNLLLEAAAGSHEPMRLDVALDTLLNPTVASILNFSQGASTPNKVSWGAQPAGSSPQQPSSTPSGTDPPRW